MSRENAVPGVPEIADIVTKVVTCAGSASETESPLMAHINLNHADVLRTLMGGRVRART